jgi:DNA-binding protein HU-beta
VNKAQLIEALSAHYDGSKNEAAKALNAVVQTITHNTASGEKVSITGFGVFEKVARPARMVRNPRTGERKRAKATAVPRFRAGSDLKAFVSGEKKVPKVKKSTAAKAATTAPTVRGSSKAAEAPTKATTTKTATAKTSATKATASKTAAKSTGRVAATAAPAKTATKKASSTTKAVPAKATAKTAAKKAPATKATPAKKSTATAATTSKAAAKKTTAKKSAANR